MHSLNCHIANVGDTIYALIPTYHNPSEFIECKFYVEFAWHSPECIYYHGVITELLSEEFSALKTLSTAQVKAVNRRTNKLSLIQLTVPMLFDKERMMQHLNLIQVDWKLDVPSPFVAGTLEDFMKLKSEVRSWFQSMINNLSI